MTSTCVICNRDLNRPPTLSSSSSSSTWTFDDLLSFENSNGCGYDGQSHGQNHHQQQQQFNSSICVNEEDFCKSFDLTQDEWKEINKGKTSTSALSTGTETPAIIPIKPEEDEAEAKCKEEEKNKSDLMQVSRSSSGQLQLVPVCSKCGGRINKLTALYTQLKAIQLEISAIRGSLLMEILREQNEDNNNRQQQPDPCDGVKSNNYSTSFRQFMQRRFSPNIDQTDLSINGRRTMCKSKRIRKVRQARQTTTTTITSDSTQNPASNSNKITDINFEDEFNDNAADQDFSMDSDSSSNDESDENREEKGENDSETDGDYDGKKSKIRGKSKVKTKTGSTTKPKRESRARPKKYKTKEKPPKEKNSRRNYVRFKAAEISPGLFRYKDQWDFEQVVNKFKCLTCNTFWASQRSTMKHIYLEHSEDRFRCDLCQKSWKTEARLKQHSCPKRVIKREFKTVELPDGRVTYDGKWEYKRVDEQVPLYQCSTCGMKKRTIQVMNRHIRQRHIDTSRFVCEECGRPFSNRHAFLTHQETHSNRVWICDQCGHEAKTRATLYLHKQTHVMWKCEHCERTFKYKEGLVAHTRKFHDTEDYEDIIPGVKKRRQKKVWELPVTCPNCRRTYAGQSTLDLHLATCRLTELKCPEPECADRPPFESYGPYQGHLYRHRKVKEKMMEGEDSGKVTENLDQGHSQIQNQNQSENSGQNQSQPALVSSGEPMSVL